MTNNQYITALKKALSGLDKPSRNDIIQEIQSHAAESGTPLLERFGSPEELAKQYLDGEITAKPVTKKILGVGNKVFAWLGVILVTLIVGVALFVWFISGDDFNYADENAAELKSKDIGWVTKSWNGPLSIKLDQASAVFYWHDEKAIRWDCLGDQAEAVEGSVVNIRQSKCIIYVPKTELTIDMEQSQAVFVRPQASVNATMRQASLRIAENGAKYQYATDSDSTKFDGLQSDESAEHSISIKSSQSMITRYEEK